MTAGKTEPIKRDAAPDKQGGTMEMKNSNTESKSMSNSNIAQSSKNTSSPVNREEIKIGRAAKQYIDAGINVLPCHTKHKRPFSGENKSFGAWAHYQTDRITWDTFKQEYVARGSNGFGWVCGKISNNLGVLDFDMAGVAFPAWKDAVCSTDAGKELFARLLIEKTQSGGFHIPAFLPESVKTIKKEKLAFHVPEDGDRGEKKTLIEALGEGSFCLCAPTPGYTVYQGTPGGIPSLTADEWDLLTTEARRLDQQKPEIQDRHPHAGSTGGKWKTRPGDAWAEQENIVEVMTELLVTHDWTEAGSGTLNGEKVQQFTRPGKSEGVSASLFQSGVFYVFTSSVEEFKPSTGYSPFSVYAALEHRDEITGIVDYRAAADALHAEGWGEPEEKGTPGRPPVDANKIARDFLAAKFPTGEPGKPGLLQYHRTWYRYKENHWEALSGQTLEQYISGYIQESDYRDRISNNLIRNVLAALNAKGVCALPDEDYAPPCRISTGEHLTTLLPLKNCILDFSRCTTDGVIQIPHSPDLFIPYCLDYDYAPSADCPEFFKYLNGVLPDERDREVLQMMAGLLLVPDTGYNVCFILYGQPGTGKSVFLSVLEKMLGERNCSHIPYAKLGERFGLDVLGEKLANLTDEMGTVGDGGDLRRLEEIFKALTGGASIQVEKKGVDPFTVKSIARLVFTTNNLPHVSDRSDALHQRLRIIPFEQVFRNGKREIPNLAEKLTREELPGILNWAVKGYIKLKGEHTTFPESPAGEVLKRDHRLECDHELRFLEECTATGGRVSSLDLYNCYCNWMKGNGLKAKSMPQFNKEVKRKYKNAVPCRSREEGGGKRTFWEGLHLSCNPFSDNSF